MSRRAKPGGGLCYGYDVVKRLNVDYQIVPVGLHSLVRSRVPAADQQVDLMLEGIEHPFVTYLF